MFILYENGLDFTRKCVRKNLKCNPRAAATEPDYRQSCGPDKDVSFGYTITQVNVFLEGIKQG